MSNNKWRKNLSPEQYRVLREGATEPPFSGIYVHHNLQGTYSCAACGQELFDSATKFNSGTGWPSFSEPKDMEYVELRIDTSYGMRRVEVRCRNCGSHLGHVFDDGPQSKRKNYCVNSIALDFKATSP